MSASLISPSLSFGLFGMQVQHQTSTHAGNILSRYGNPCKLNPCPSVCYLHVLTKAQGKGTWAFPKKLAKALDNYLAKEGCLEDPFSKQILRNYQPCVSTPKTPEQHKECVKQKRLSITNLAQICLILQLWRNIPLTTMTSIELRLLNTCCITQKVRC